MGLVITMYFDSIARNDQIGKKLARMVCLKNRKESVIFHRCRFQKNCRYLQIPINWHFPNYNILDNQVSRQVTVY